MEKPHKKLDAWKLAMDLAVQIYRTTESFPISERYALTAQIHRAAMSVPSNIAEGAARQTRKEFINFLHTAQGSLSELDTLIEFSTRLGFLGQQVLASLDAQMQRVDMTISGLIRHQRSKGTHK
jgi:four helix bundle protein